MALYNLFSYNVEIQYKSYLLSKATFFTTLTIILNVILPFIVSYRSRGFWLKSSYFYEQPLVHSTYEYLLIAETDDPSVNIICGDAAGLNNEIIRNEENCVEIEIQEDDHNDDGKNDVLKYKFHLIIPKDRTISSVFLILGIDFQIMDVCSVQMQSLVIINQEFNMQPNGFKYNGNLEIYQSKHLPCLRNILDSTNNKSLFKHESYSDTNMVDIILDEYQEREAITTIKPVYSRVQNGHTGTMDLNIKIKVPELEFRYTPSFLQEIKWAWPQYLSLLLIFYWLFEKIRRFVFSNRLLMAWEIVPWRRKHI